MVELGQKSLLSILLLVLFLRLRRSAVKSMTGVITFLLTPAIGDIGPVVPCMFLLPRKRVHVRARLIRLRFTKFLVTLSLVQWLIPPRF